MDEALGATMKPAWARHALDDFGASRLLRWSLLFGLFVVLLFFAHANVLRHPRFWAEEGTVYYQYCARRDVAACLSFAHIGGLQLIENLLVFFATRGPLQFAPAITTYGSLAILCLIVVQLIAFAQAARLGLAASCLLVAALCLLPANYETWLTATNVQWVCAISALLVLASPSPAAARGRWLQIGWLAVCGLSGIPSVLTAPLFGVRMLDERSSYATALFVAIAGAGVVQVLAVHFLGEHAARPFALHPSVFLAADSLQTIWAPVFSVDAANSMAAAATSPQFWASLAAWTGCVALALAVAALLALAGFTSPSRRFALYLVLGGLFVTNVQVFCALDQKEILSGWGGARYFLFGSACLSLLAALGTTSTYRALRAASFCALFAIVIAGVVTAKFSELPSSFSGPDWRRELKNCPPDAPCAVSVWPYGWTITVVRDR
jgi:hypothetical protein